MFFSFSWVLTESLLVLNTKRITTERKNNQRKSETDTKYIWGAQKKSNFFKNILVKKNMTRNDSYAEEYKRMKQIEQNYFYLAKK